MHVLFAPYGVSFYSNCETGDVPAFVPVLEQRLPFRFEGRQFSSTPQALSGLRLNRDLTFSRYIVHHRPESTATTIGSHLHNGWLTAFRHSFEPFNQTSGSWRAPLPRGFQPRVVPRRPSRLSRNRELAPSPTTPALE
ncbi:hypothetical protein Agau_P100027 (plasmid) [Agrobacterium tumefaciens F2]|nr:hypothetical protein Agau_P100027 [Agrobacterium tumefaciens F2]